MTKFSKEDRTKLASIHKDTKDCCTKLDALGYKDADDDEGAGKTAKATKAFGYGAPPVVKKAATSTNKEALAKIGLASTLKKVK